MSSTVDAPVTFNPYAVETHLDPFPIYRRLRAEAPVYRNDELGFYTLARYDDVLAALHDPDTYCSSQGITLEPRSPLPMMITLDPPEHTTMRRLVSRAFTPRRIADLEPVMRVQSEKWLAPFASSGSCDLIADYAAKLPMDVISTMIGVPARDQDLLRGWTDAMIDREDGNPEILPHGIEGAANLYGYFLEQVKARRRRPGDDLTTALIEAEADGRRLTDDEIVSFNFLLAIAGNETTTKLIGNAMYWLWRHPDQRADVLADPSLLPATVEEVLRYEGSTQLMARTTTRDVEVRGVRIPAGEKVLVLLGSANRDEDVFDRPEEFDLHRESKPHVGFGHGIHVCLGAAMARLEMRIALEHLIATLRDYEIDEAGLVRINSGNVRGYSSMPVTFTPA